MNKILIYLILSVFVFSCGNRQKTEETEQTQENFKWLSLENKDSVKIVGLSERSLKGIPEPYVFVHYESDRFNGNGKDEKFRSETLLIAKALRENGKFPDTLILQAMGVSKTSGFIKNQTNFNTVVFFNGQEWTFTEK